MNKKFKVSISMVAVALCSIFFVVAKEISLRSENRLKDIIIKDRYAVLMLYKEDKDTRKDKKMTEDLRYLKETFKAVSSDDFYKESDLSFLTSNVAKKELVDLPEKLGVKQLPAFVLFQDGKAIRGADGQKLILSGFVARDALQGFIDQNLKDELEDVIEEKAEIRKRELEEARIRSYYAPQVYFGLGYGYPYGYYGYPYGYYGGWGWGGRWGW